jgi:hypothetical protein
MFNDRKRFLMKVNAVIEKCITDTSFFVKRQFGNRMVKKFRAEGTILAKVQEGVGADKYCSMDTDSEIYFKRK